MAKKAGKLGFWNSAREAFGEGREEWTRSFREGRELQGKAEQSTRWDEMTGAYPTGVRLKEMIDDVRVARGAKLPDEVVAKRKARERQGLEPKVGFQDRAGQLAGTVAADVTQDSLRNFIWLLNAAQASGNVIAENVMSATNRLGRERFKTGAPDLYGKTRVGFEDGGAGVRARSPMQIKKAQELGYLNDAGRPKKGYNIDSEGFIEKRNFDPGNLAALMIPTGIAINTGLGLMTPFGGAEGYKAALPSDIDPNKTDNVIGEIGMKYLMGRTGNLLPYNEFVKVRPDVSPEEYGAYQAFKYDKGMDLNIFDDGKVGLPGGILKYTNEGIHGPEVQFLGRSLPATTGLMPFGFALAGSAVGVGTRRPIKHGFIGGMAGLAVGQVTGNLLENERRRRNTVENQLNSPQY